MDGLIEVKRVVGFGHKQVIVANTFFFRRNCAPVVAEEVMSITKTVLIDTCKVLFGKVLLTGRLRKDVLLREFSGCSADVARVGDVLVEVPFQADLEVPRARPGDKCIVLKAFVEGEQETPLWRMPGGGFKGLADSSVVFLCGKVVRDGIIDDHGDCDCSDSSSGWGHHRDCDDHHDGHCCEEHHLPDGSGSLGHSLPDPDYHFCEHCGQTHSCRSGSGGSPDHDHKKKGRRRKGCPIRKTTGLTALGDGKVPDAEPGPNPGAFIGPTILFPGVF